MPCGSAHTRQRTRARPQRCPAPDTHATPSVRFGWGWGRWRGVVQGLRCACACPAMPMRPPSRVDMETLKPAPSGPSI
eukprot:scaffold33433_cov60-Phaeocystis_antarctica.AAC.1